jgi:hypothetical protein
MSGGVEFSYKLGGRNLLKQLFYHLRRSKISGSPYMEGKGAPKQAASQTSRCVDVVSRLQLGLEVFHFPPFFVRFFAKTSHAIGEIHCNQGWEFRVFCELVERNVLRLTIGLNPRGFRKDRSSLGGI